MTETDKSEETSGIAILPKTGDRPIAIVGMGSSEAELLQVKLLSERLGNLGMEHTVLSLEDAKKEGITREDLISAQLEQKQAEGLLAPNRLFDGGGTKLKKGGGSKAQQKFKRKKKGKKTHRKKR